MGEPGLPGLDIRVGDGEGVAATLVKGFQDVIKARWLGNGDSTCDGAVGRVGGPDFSLECGNNGFHGVGLNCVEFRESVDGALSFKLLETYPRTEEEGAVAYGHDYVVGECFGEISGQFVGEGLSALEEVGAKVMGGVDEVILFAEGEGGIGGGFSGAGDEMGLGAVDLDLVKLGPGCRVGGEDVGLDAAPGGIGSNGGPGVAGGVLDYFVDAKVSGGGEH